MFIGHFGAAFGTKKIESRPSLGTMFMAAQLVDLLWPVFLLLGIEKVEISPGISAFTPLDFVYYPFTHSLAAAIFWGVVFGGIYFMIKKNKRGAIVLGLLVISHWVLDFITHIPDLPLTPWSSSKFGLGLWNSTLLTLIVEGFIFAGGAFLYFKSTKAKNKAGTFALWGLIIFLAIIYIMNIAGPPPPDSNAIGFAGLSMWLIAAWGYWIDRNRSAI